MTHRGAVSSDGNGDGAGILVGIPHEFMKREFKLDLDLDIPELGKYAVGNVFFKKGEKNNKKSLAKCQKIFEDLAASFNLSVLGWRKVPVDSTILGDVALSREPTTLQPVSYTHLDVYKRQEGQFGDDFTSAVRSESWAPFKGKANIGLIRSGRDYCLRCRNAKRLDRVLEQVTV